MKNSKVQAIVLAGGRSSRFKTGRSKLMADICGQAMVVYTTKQLEMLQIPLTILVGYEREALQSLLVNVHGNNTIQFFLQE